VLSTGLNLAIGGLFTKGVAAVLVLLAITLFLRARVLHVLRLAPGLRTPVRWRWALIPSRSARLHRRLQVVAGVCLDALGSRAKPPGRLRRRRGPVPEPVDDAHRQLRALVDQAVELDTRLGRNHRANTTARERRAALRGLADEVDQLESSARAALARLRHAKAETGTVLPDRIIDERPAATTVEPDPSST
jgi:hypothetical protein